MSGADQSDEMSSRCMLILKEAGVPEKTLWLVEIQTLTVFAKTFANVADEVLPRAEDEGHDFIVYHHQNSRVTAMATFNSEVSADIRRACWELAKCLVREKRHAGNNRYLIECEHCRGSGLIPQGDDSEECPACEGTGFLPTSEGLELIDALEALRPWWKEHGKC